MAALLQEFGPDIWVADGPVVPFYGFPYPTRMGVIRLSDGDLFVWSPIGLSPALQREIDALGRVRHLVSPNRLHHLFLPEWKAAYPDARLYASPGLRRKRRDLAFDSALGDMPELAGAADIARIHRRRAPRAVGSKFRSNAPFSITSRENIGVLSICWMGGRAV